MDCPIVCWVVDLSCFDVSVVSVVLCMMSLIYVDLCTICCVDLFVLFVDIVLLYVSYCFDLVV